MDGICTEYSNLRRRQLSTNLPLVYVTAEREKFPKRRVVFNTRRWTEHGNLVCVNKSNSQNALDIPRLGIAADTKQGKSGHCYSVEPASGHHLEGRNKSQSLVQVESISDGVPSLACYYSKCVDGQFTREDCQKSCNLTSWA